MLIPSENEKDLADVPQTVKDGLEIIPVSTVDEAMAHALTGPLIPIEWNEEQAAVTPIPADEMDDPAVLTH